MITHVTVFLHELMDFSNIMEKFRDLSDGYIVDKVNNIHNYYFRNTGINIIEMDEKILVVTEDGKSILLKCPVHKTTVFVPGRRITTNGYDLSITKEKEKWF